MTKETVTILEYLTKALEENGETVDSIEAILVGELISESYNPKPGILHQQNTIDFVLAKPYEVTWNEVSIPEFYAWTNKFVYFLHYHFESDHGYNEHYRYEVNSVPRNPVIMSPEGISM